MQVNTARPKIVPLSPKYYRLPLSDCKKLCRATTFALIVNCDTLGVSEMTLRIVVVTTAVVMLLATGELRGQPYVDTATSARFAQLTLGAGITSFHGNAGAESVAGSITVGGLHFWGHSHFYITATALMWHRNEERWSPTVETGADIYPWRIERGRVVPFVGLAWVASRRRRDDGPAYDAHEAVARLGLTAAVTTSTMLHATIAAPFMRSVPYPSATGEVSAFLAPLAALSLSATTAFDMTQSVESLQRDGIEERRNAAAERLGLFNGLFASIGVSSATALSRPTWLASQLPMLDVPPPSTTYPSVGIGYSVLDGRGFLHAVFRHIASVRHGYGSSVSLERTSLGLEAALQIANYHGFVPFVGAGVGVDWLSTDVSHQGLQQIERTNGLTPIFVFGWDIVPTRLQKFTLRTTCRYSPVQRMATSRGNVPFNHLEIDFIQFIWHFRR